MPILNPFKELNWKLSLPFIKHTCSVGQNYEIWLCSTDAYIEHEPLHGSTTCITTTVDGKQSEKQYLSRAHISGNLLTITDGKSLVIIGGRNRRNSRKENIIAVDDVEFCDEGMSY